MGGARERQIVESIAESHRWLERQGRRVPSDEVVRFVVREVLRERPFRSQEAFAAAVRTRLRKADPAYALGGARLKRIAAKSGVRVQVATRLGRAPKRCPGCGRGLQKVFFKNLAGKAVLTGLRCRCGYRGSDRRLAPARYSFSA